MVIIAIIFFCVMCYFGYIGIILPLKEKFADTAKEKKWGKIAGITVFAILFVLIMVLSANSESKRERSKTSYYDLTPQEQENAKWAYEVNQAINGN